MDIKDYELIVMVQKVFSADRPEFEWLNMLREHGRLMDMVQAEQSLQDAFGIDQREAKKALLEWMKWVQQKAHTEQHS